MSAVSGEANSMKRQVTAWIVAILLSGTMLFGQQSITTSSVTVPRLVNFSGKATDSHGKAISGVAGATFAIYKDQYEGSPLWVETQNIQGDAKGNYVIQLGATKPEGLPLDLFTSGEARWLGVTINGDTEQPRVLLLSVPYALKAADAETVGGLPASAFMLAPPLSAGSQSLSASNPVPASSGNPPPATSNVVTTGGTINAIPLWSTATDIQSSAISQTGSGTSAKVGVNTATPATTLDVNGAATVRGNLSLPSIGTATSTAGKNSQPNTLIASAFNSSTGTAVAQNFRWQAEPVLNNTTTASGSLNLLYGSGSNAPAETGLKIANNGQLTFAKGQTFPGTGPGTVKSVSLSAPSLDFTVTGSPVTSSGTLALNWIVAPTSGNVANAIVKRDPNGSFSANLISAGTMQPAQIIMSSGADTAINTTSTCASCIAIFGDASSSAGGTVGVMGQSDSPNFGAKGVLGVATGASGETFGVLGQSNSTGGTGVSGRIGSQFGTIASGIAGTVPTGVLGDSSGYGVAATSDSSNALIVVNGSTADAALIFANGGGAPIFAQGTGGSLFLDANGNLSISGSISKSGGSFKIDHPLEPANKYLYHSFVESPDMKNIYDGVATLDAHGEAVVQMPEWFAALNRDFRYQLTCIGGFAPVYIARKMQSNSFEIAGGRPGLEVSWQVTGIRQDPYANAHRIPVEEPKSASERGYYIHPELYGAAREKSLAFLHRAEQARQAREKSAQAKTAQR